MTRNFGMGDGRPTVGAFRQPSVSSGTLNSPSNLNSFDERELGAWVLFAAVIVCPVIIVLRMVFFYMGFIA